MVLTRMTHPGRTRRTAQRAVGAFSYYEQVLGSRWLIQKPAVFRA
jgi:hypothetical protein